MQCLNRFVCLCLPFFSFSKCVVVVVCYGLYLVFDVILGNIGHHIL